MRTPFGEWAPDLDPLLAQKQLQVAKNVLPKTGGYAPMPGPANLNAQALPFAPKGAFRLKRDDGTNAFFAAVHDTGTNGMKLYHFKPTDIGGGVIEDRWVDVSRSLAYLSILQRRVEFAQFDSIVFAASYANETQVLDIDRDSQFANGPSGMPRAAHIAVAENQLWTGDLFTRDAGVIRNGVQWSAINDPLNHPLPGTDAATAVLSGRQIFEGNGGPVNAIVPGSEVVGVFQEEATWRADFVGGDVVWRFSNIEDGIGCNVKGAAVAFERRVFFLAEDGFRVSNYTSSMNVGKDRVNDWFAEHFDPDYPDSLSMQRDPLATRIWVSFAAKGNAGVPNRLMVYDYALDRFAYGETTLHSLIGAGTTPASLDSADVAGDRDVLEDDLTGSGDLNYGILSFDDRETGTGARVIGGFDSSFRLAQLAGTNLDGELETGDLELVPGQRSMLSGVRSHVRGREVTIQVAGIDDQEPEDPHALDWSLPEGRERGGIHPVRRDALYHRLRFNLGRDWTEASFYDPDPHATGRM